MGARDARAGTLVGHADLALLAAALPVFVLADWPLLGYGVAASVWLATRLGLTLAERHIRNSLARGERRNAVAIKGFTTIGRVWVVAAAVLLVGVLGAREDGLAAAILAAALFTAQFLGTALARVLAGEGLR